MHQYCRQLKYSPDETHGALIDLGVSLWTPPSVSDLAILEVESLSCPTEWSYRTWFATLNSVHLQPGYSKGRRQKQLIQK